MSVCLWLIEIETAIGKKAVCESPDSGSAGKVARRPPCTLSPSHVLHRFSEPPTITDSCRISLLIRSWVPWCRGLPWRSHREPEASACILFEDRLPDGCLAEVISGVPLLDEAQRLDDGIGRILVERILGTFRMKLVRRTGGPDKTPTSGSAFCNNCPPMRPSGLTRVRRGANT